MALCVLLEGAVRLSRYVVRGPNSTLTVDDPELGWVHNLKRPKVTRTNSCGEEVVTLTPPNPYIIRYPHTTSGTHVLFLGDSSTHAHEVSTGAAFYDVFEAGGQGQYAVWAAGAGGYGSLQEYLVLQKIYDEVRPNIVIWQLDSNDVGNNVFELDSTSIFNNVKPRPYLNPGSGTIEMRDPGLFLFKISDGARVALPRLIALDVKYKLGFIGAAERWLGSEAENRPMLILRGLRVLDTVLGKAVRSYPQTRFIGFSISGADDQEYADVFTKHGAGFWPNFSARVRAHSKQTDCLPWDGHWNHEGNRIAGKLIAELLINY